MFVAREGRLLAALAAKMAGARGEAVFEVWMKRESDLVRCGPARCVSVLRSPPEPYQ